MIVLAASLVIVSPFAYSAWNISALGGLELRSSQHDRFSFFEISNGRPIEACNPSPFPVSFEGLEITIFYENDDEGTYTVGPSTLQPSSLALLEGTFRSESHAESRYTFLHMDAQFAGTAPIRLDPNRMHVEVDVHVPILGLVPYMITERYTALDFYNTMNEDAGTFGC